MRTPNFTTHSVRIALAAIAGLVMFGTSPAAYALSDLMVPDFEEVVPEAAAVAPTVIPDSVTVATTCISCQNRGVRGSRRDPLRAVVERAPRAKAPVSNAFEEKLGLTTWREAIAGRRSAKFRGGRWRSGNVSKSMCASVVKDILLEMGVCTSRPDGDAYNLYGNSTLVANCPHISKMPTNKIASAKKASVIIYSGHVSRKVHHFGHIELKIPVTAALKKKFGRDRWVSHVPVGGYIYCSDFCRAKPSANRTAKVAAIYEITGGRE